MYIERAAQKLVRRYSEHFKVVVVTGPRQVGKTTMLKHLMDEDAAAGDQRAYVTLDNTAQLALAKEDPALFLQRYHPPVLIDEIQKAPELLPYIKELVDASDEHGSVWLTGSQPFHLMQKVSESLAGRVGVIEMLGLSNAEIAGLPTEPFDPSPDYFTRRVAAASPIGVNEIYNRIFTGCLPGIYAMPEDLRAAAYESYIDTYLMRDIRDLAQVGDHLRFRRFMEVCAALTGRQVNYAEISRIADIDEKTAKTWLSLLVGSYIVRLVQPYSNNLIKRLGKRPVMHFLDTGLAAHLAGWSSARALELGAMAGSIFESYAFGEVCKGFVNSGQHPGLFFFRTNDKKEIDMLLERDGTLYPIEVKKTASPTKKDARNMGALDAVAADEIPNELCAFKREVGMGCVLCLASDTFPLSGRVWAFPVWAL